ncbi:diguanylate cyclase [Shewanella sp. VB17]|uniref:tetratricopeptide repeat-containing diguanylate cyclase n=1 Tax=Shewanella sp. VB17 TaxID=2739432 RepID=UPI0015640D38|nr:GGDEF domain-containing protein [Shewanella sp. VB17]NRD73283.1 diguanylate cyclase [Shewanella sp. VB17]
MPVCRFIVFAVVLACYFSVVSASEFEVEIAQIEDAITSSGTENVQRIEELYQLRTKLTKSEYARVLILDSVTKILAGRYDIALKRLNVAETLPVSEIQLAQIYTYKVASYLSIKQYSAALGILTLYLSLVENTDNIEKKAAAYVRVADFYLELEAFDEVTRYANMAIRTKGLSSTNRCYSLLSLAMAELNLNNYISAKKRYLKAVDFCDANAVPMGSAFGLKGIGEINLKTGDFDNALIFLLKSLKGYQFFDYKMEINSVNALLSETYLALSQYELAAEFAQGVINLPSNPSNLKPKKIATQVMASLLYQKGKYQQAFDYLTSYQVLSIDILDDTKAKANAYQMAKFESGEKTREINLLNKERELYSAKEALTESQRNHERMLFLFICGGLIVLTMFAISMTLQRSKYKKLVQFDVLTGIYNRATAQNMAEDLFIKGTANGAHFSVILFDLDYFKHINDQYGHAVGDWVLKKVCETVAKKCRNGDIFTRFGGEEFVIFLPNTNESKALKVAEQCRELITTIDSRYSGHLFTVHASFGVSSNTVEDLSVDPMLNRADMAMYSSKEHGRNRVSVYHPDMQVFKSNS